MFWKLHLCLFPLPKSFISGKGGQTIKDLQSSTGASIRVSVNQSDNAIQEMKSQSIDFYFDVVICHWLYCLVKQTPFFQNNWN